MLSRLARWWLARGERRAARAWSGAVGECTTCGGPATHTIVSRFVDDVEADVAGAGGGTGMSADYCPEHCPGGCETGCANMVG